MADQTTDRDPLTQALNRAAFDRVLGREVAEALARDTRLTLILVDLDHFKSVNDAFGHGRGDQVLIEFARRVHSIIRGSDEFFRYGGDEFVLLLPQTGKAQADMLCRRLLQRIRQEPFQGEPPLTLSLSIGIAELAEARSAEALFGRADQRLMEAKRTGRSQVVAAEAAQPHRQLPKESTRLIEREGELDRAHRFLDALPREKRGILHVVGEAGAGRTRFLAEIAQAGGLRGYEILSLLASPSLYQRAYGAVSESSFRWKGEPLELASVRSFIAEVPGHLRDLGRVGLLILVDSLQHLDPWTAALVQSLMSAPALTQVALVYTADQAHPHRAVRPEIALHETIALRPLSIDGLRIWLREALSWEPDQRLLAWLHKETGGWPAQVQRGLEHLLQEEAIARQGGQWKTNANLTAIPLRSLLNKAATSVPLPAGGQAAFVGREESIRRVKQLLRDHRLVLVLGPGGIGKSHLALQVAAELGHTYREGVCYVSLASAAGPEHLAPTLATALRYNFFSGQDPEVQLQHFLRRRNMLIVLDTVEHLSEATDFLDRLLKTAPGITLLVTSREPLNVPHAASLELTGMPVPDLEGTVPLEDFSVVQLFVDRARRVHPDFTLSDADRPALARICRLVEGMPLGIEMAAAWVQTLSCPEIASGIETSLDFLRAAGSAGHERHQNLRAPFDHFWNSLSAGEQHAVGALALFRGGISQRAAEAVADASFFFLSALVNRSMLREVGPRRYAMHEVLRQYSQEQLEGESHSAAEARDRHARYFASLLHSLQADLNGNRQKEALETIEGELGNVREAMRWANRQGDRQALQMSFESLFRFHDIRTRFLEGQEALRGASAAIEAGLGESGSTGDATNLLLGQLLARQGRLAFRRSQYAEARNLLERSLELLGQLDHPLEVSFALNCLGDIARVAGDYDRAHSYHERALTLSRAAGDIASQANSLNGLGVSAASRGDLVGAKALLSESLAGWRSTANEWSIAGVLNNLGNVASLLQQEDEAMALFQESLEIQRRLGDQRGAANALNNLGLTAEAMGDLPAALRLYAASLHTYQEIGDQWGAALSLANQGKASLTAGNAEQAMDYLVEAAHTGMAVEALPVVLESAVALASLRLAEGQWSPALELMYLAVGSSATDPETKERANASLAEYASAVPPERERQALHWAGGDPSLEQIFHKVEQLAAAESQPVALAGP